MAEPQTLEEIFQGMSDGGTKTGENFKTLQALLDAEALKGKVLWSGTPTTMGDGSSITLDIDPSQCPTGIEFVWSLNATSNDICSIVVTKGWIANHPAPNTIDMPLSSATGGHKTQKTLAISGKTVTGNKNNTLTDTVSGKSADYVLLQVLGA